MSNILRESGFQKKVLIGVAAAGLGIGAYYGISRLKSRPRGKDKSKSPKQDPAGGSDCEQLKQADKVPVHPNVKLDSDELHVNVCVDSHRSPEHNPAKEDSKQHDLSLSGTFEKISPPCSATSAESARQQSQASDALGESFEQLSLSQVQPLVEPEPQQDGNGQKSLYSLDSPIEDKYVQISISQAVESAPAALERTEQPSNPEDTSSSSPDTSSAHPPTEEQDGAGNKPTREQPSEVLSREQQPPVPAGGESPRVHGHDKEERADEYPSYSAVCVEAITQEVSASEEGHCSLSEDDNEFKEEEQNDIVLVEKKNESADNEPNQTEEFDPSKVSPVFGGRNVHKISDNINLEDFDPSIAHPAFVGYAESVEMNQTFNTLLSVPHPLRSSQKISFGAHLTTDTIEERTKHIFSNCSQTGLAKQIGLRDGDQLVCINGMTMEGCAHHVVVALLVMEELVDDAVLCIDITVLPEMPRFCSIDEEEETFSGEIMCKTFECRIRLDESSNELNVQTISKEAHYEVKKNLLCMHNASTEKCYIQVLNKGYQRYLRIEEGRLVTGALPEEKDISFCFKKTHFHGLENNSKSRYYNNLAFVMIFNTTSTDVKKYICSGNRKSVGLLNLRSEEHKYVQNQIIKSDTDPRYFYWRTTGRGYDYFESTLQQGHFLAYDGEKLFLKFISNASASVESDQEIQFRIRPWDLPV